MKGLRIGFAISGSFCTIDGVLSVIQSLADEGADITPILSFSASTTDTRFGRCADLHAKLEKITGKKPLDTLVGVEPIGPQGLLDVLVVAPCTGSSRPSCERYQRHACRAGGKSAAKVLQAGGNRSFHQ